MILNDIQIRSGVVGGTLFSTALNISPHDFLFTAIMAVIGTVVSFLCFIFPYVIGSAIYWDTSQKIAPALGDFGVSQKTKVYR